jgi:hypothetical protein
MEYYREDLDEIEIIYVGDEDQTIMYCNYRLDIDGLMEMGVSGGHWIHLEKILTINRNILK